MVDEKIKKLLIAEFEAIPPIEELKKMYTFSERHNNRMEAIFAEERRRERFERYFAAVKKVAMFALVILGLAVVSLKVVPTVYAYVESWITENLDDRIIFKDNYADENSTDKTLRFELGYVPNGYELESEEYNKTGNCVISYKNHEGALLQLRYYGNLKDNQLSMNTEGTLVEEVVIDGIRYYVFESQDARVVVTWENEGYLLSLAGSFEKSEMLDIAFAVKSVEDK